MDSDSLPEKYIFKDEIITVQYPDEIHDSEAFERRTMRYVDFRILPLLALLYAFALIDRVNLGAAYTAGMGKDLNLEIKGRYSIATCLYFVPYILLQLPGTLVLRKLGVRNFIAFIVVAWGAVQLSMGFVPAWGYLTLCRILMGALESAFFPAVIFVITTWYRRYEVQKRSGNFNSVQNDCRAQCVSDSIAVFYMLSITASGFSSILAYALSLLDGKRGIRGWRWIFIIEGAITIFLGMTAWLIIPDFPDKNTFLSRKQTSLVLKRIEDDRGDSTPDKITFRKVVHHLGDWPSWAYGVMFACSSLPAYAQAYFMPLILKGMGWSSANALLLSAPPYGPSIITCFLFSWISDRTRHRGGFIAIQALVCIVGLVLTAFTTDNGVRYFGIFLTNAGNSGTIPGILAYASNNVATQSKRSVQSAVTMCFGGVAGIIASTTFRTQDAPRYLPGLGVAIGSQVTILTILGITNIYFRRMNRLAREGKLNGPLQGQPGFLYTL